jgi:hypothetical protein
MAMASNNSEAVEILLNSPDIDINAQSIVSDCLTKYLKEEG